MPEIRLEHATIGATNQQFFYERLLSSHKKEEVAAEIHALEPAKRPEDIIRDPYVLEFLGLEPNASFYESDL